MMTKFTESHWQQTVLIRTIAMMTLMRDKTNKIHATRETNGWFKRKKYFWSNHRKVSIEPCTKFVLTDWCVWILTKPTTTTKISYEQWENRIATDFLWNKIVLVSDRYVCSVHLQFSLKDHIRAVAAVAWICLVYN